MPDLQIKTESLPERCEICHQADRFDRETNFCSRCQSAQLIAAELAKQSSAQSALPSPTLERIVNCMPSARVRDRI